MNLACKAVLAAITDVKFAEEDAEEYIPGNDYALTTLQQLDKNSIATLRSLIKTVLIIFSLSFP